MSTWENKKAVWISNILGIVGALALLAIALPSLESSAEASIFRRCLNLLLGGKQHEEARSDSLPRPTQTTAITQPARTARPAQSAIPTNPAQRDPLRTPNSNTASLIAYLANLHSRKILSDTELGQFLKRLEEGTIENPISEDEASLNSAHLIHREGIDALLKNRDLESDLLRDWTRTALHLAIETQNARDEARSETQSLAAKYELHPVPTGKFIMGFKKIPIELTHPFEVMSTPMTQRHWIDLFGVNPSKNKSGADATEVDYKGTPVAALPENPVENITWWAAAVAANKLSELHGLKPAYDLSEITWHPKTSAADGSLLLISGHIKINAPNQNIYLTEGYRMPTEAEQEYLLHLESEANGKYSLEDRAWFKKNSGDTTQPVATRRPLVLNGREIFDLLGNVQEWGHGAEMTNLKRGKDPVGSILEEKPFPQRFSIRGTAFDSSAMFLTPQHAMFCAPGYRHEDIGVRFVRTMR